jgi:hypothetical protein
MVQLSYMKKHKPIIRYILVSIITLVLLATSILVYKYVHISIKSKPNEPCMSESEKIEYESEKIKTLIGCGLIRCEDSELKEVYTFSEYNEYNDINQCGGRRPISYYPRDIMFYTYATLLSVSGAVSVSKKLQKK